MSFLEQQVVSVPLVQLQQPINNEPMLEIIDDKVEDVNSICANVDIDCSTIRDAPLIDVSFVRYKDKDSIRDYANFAFLVDIMHDTEKILICDKTQIQYDTIQECNTANRNVITNDFFKSRYNLSKNKSIFKSKTSCGDEFNINAPTKNKKIIIGPSLHNLSLFLGNKKTETKKKKKKEKNKNENNDTHIKNMNINDINFSLIQPGKENNKIHNKRDNIERQCNRKMKEFIDISNKDIHETDGLYETAGFYLSPTKSASFTIDTFPVKETKLMKLKINEKYKFNVMSDKFDAAGSGNERYYNETIKDTIFVCEIPVIKNREKILIVYQFKRKPVIIETNRQNKLRILC